MLPTPLYLSKRILAFTERIVELFGIKVESSSTFIENESFPERVTWNPMCAELLGKLQYYCFWDGLGATVATRKLLDPDTLFKNVPAHKFRTYIDGISARILQMVLGFTPVTSSNGSNKYIMENFESGYRRRISRLKSVFYVTLNQ